jgi:GNAT superfamily N-acetyltransferase
VADVYLRSRQELVACAPLAHAADDVRRWIRDHLLHAGHTTVAVADGQVVGFMSFAADADCGWIDQLYLHPAWVGRGIGSQLLSLALSELRPPVRLYTFQCNHAARAFYERRGFQVVAFGDGSGNEEGCPDVLYEWWPES